MAFYIRFYAYAIIVHTLVDQLPQLFMEQFDTFNIQCRHIEYMHEGVWFRKNNLDKMTAVGTKRFFPKYGFCICIDSAFIGRSTSITAFDRV